MNKKQRKQFEEKCLRDDNTLICNCGRKIHIEDIIFIHPINMNRFNWWMYEVVFDKNKQMKTKLKPMKWYGYIGYIPVLKEIPYYLHKWFAKKDYCFDIECKHCEDEEK